MKSMHSVSYRFHVGTGTFTVQHKYTQLEYTQVHHPAPRNRRQTNKWIVRYNIHRIYRTYLGGGHSDCIGIRCRRIFSRCGIKASGERAIIAI